MLKKLIAFTFVATLLFSCSSDDDSSGGSNCPNLVSQSAQGNFKGNNFVTPGGTFQLSPGQNNGYTCKIYVESRTGGSCTFPIFNNDSGPQDTILFSIPDLSNQTLTFSDTGGNAINFNRVTIENNRSVTILELSVCGTVNITNHDTTNDTLSGNIVARGQDGSEVNGTFTLDLCVF